MKLFGSVLYMYAVTAVISFFVAFLIRSIFILISKIEIPKTTNDKYPEPAEIIPISREAENPLKEGEINAAIAAALHLYLAGVHDKENTVLTINKVARTYSPWSSKIYGLNQWRR